ncbi:F0F1 ATP synthase subunit delta [Dongshaea marina]|uniref:F0F1 ATP synthase subunit delta n=1 Tax=Dongshaea marina TaxID=2047966 RepID=UPI000D3E788C|nr:F0F1 ATP synthase subunit delta [Dongshaea marina]
MSEVTTVARPYAKAAFDFAVEKGTIEQWMQMLSFAAEVAQNETIENLIGSAINVEKLADIFVQVCGDQVDQHGKNLIKLMAENGRLEVLPAVLKLFTEMKIEHEKEVCAEVVSAKKLDAAQQKKILASLEKRLERKVKLDCRVDPSLMAGMVIKAGDLVIDGSVRSQLDRLSEALRS